MTSEPEDPVLVAHRVQLIVTALRDAARALVLGRSGNVLAAILTATHKEDGLFEQVVQVAYAEALSNLHEPDPASEDPLHDWADAIGAPAAARLLKLAAKRLEGPGLEVNDMDEIASELERLADPEAETP